MAVDILVYTKDEKTDTLATALVGWRSRMRNAEKKRESEKLLKMLQIQLEREDIRIIEIK